ncbi:tetrathionate reductase family octaheme c-type cytochrome [Thermophagus xiamenensis]|uniref:Octaheme c-type cytochrome, tetrathionate reductase family n=1 Tax=Thermophagus xiamenensis TaxID=385682 RepID=A0A1I1UD27_9BACT|nr:tetrathionate reductase family octaheme c-type cytochrome [Thermophagus xiamenensis]SFD68741.1 octaheme c-type cytochrome, tetrathionate reductase family [Thermophagus xiamenensis]
MQKVVFSVIVFTLALLALLRILYTPPLPNLKEMKLRQEYAIKPKPAVDHSLFPELQKDFKTPQEVTEACIGCHNQRHKEIIASSHWNWERISYIEGRGIASIGKSNVINNFCIGATSNEQACAKCHIGFGMGSDQFSFEAARNVDCMVCHDNSEEYIKGASMAGYPDRSVNLTKVAQNVGRPQSMNCGSCHFYSGGGNNVKHGDLEDALLSATREIDVHMAVNGINMTCVDCHSAENHQIKGKLYSVSSGNENRLTCDHCHTNTPHMDRMLNLHTARVACQTCHIPTYAKVNPTKMEWRWSEAGKLIDGQPYHIVDTITGAETYMSIKGSFVWKTNVEPEYFWFNGQASHYILGDKVDSIPVQVNRLMGSASDPQSKIFPVKVHRGDQIYDPKTKMLIQPKLWAAIKGDSAYWQDFDWNLAAEAGMKRVGLPYSGEYEFVETEMYWPVNHMVAPKDMALSCEECHTRHNSRLASITDFYMPGRDTNAGIDLIGKLLIIAAITGVILHTLGRIAASVKNREIETEVINTHQ